MELSKLYRQVENHIRRVDMQALWEGFQPLRFALYDEKDCCFDGKMIEKTPEFLANTSIEYHGEQIAIWNVQNDIDPLILASKLIHEMFHGYQRLNAESRFPDELHALHTYQYTDENLSVKLQENRLLAVLAQSFSQQVLSELLSLRKYRLERFPNEFLYEAKTEQIEGTATYVELSALKCLSPELFEKRLAQMCKEIVNPASLLPVRIVSYDVGALLLLVLKQNGIAMPTAFEDQTFAEVLLTNYEAASPCKTGQMKPYIEAYYHEARLAIENAVSENDVIFDGETPLLGVNFYNAVYLDGHILSKYFVMYGDVQSPTIKYGDFLIRSPKPGIATKIFALT